MVQLLLDQSQVSLGGRGHPLFGHVQHLLRNARRFRRAGWKGNDRIHKSGLQGFRRRKLFSRQRRRAQRRRSQFAFGQSGKARTQG